MGWLFTVWCYAHCRLMLQVTERCFLFMPYCSLGAAYGRKWWSHSHHALVTLSKGTWNSCPSQPTLGSWIWLDNVGNVHLGAWHCFHYSTVCLLFLKSRNTNRPTRCVQILQHSIGIFIRPTYFNTLLLLPVCLCLNCVVSVAMHILTVWTAQN